MLKINQAMTLTGASYIKEDDTDIQVAYMNANVPNNGKVSIGRTIENDGMFEKHKNEVLVDFADFDEYAYSLIPQIAQIIGETKKEDK